MTHTFRAAIRRTLQLMLFAALLAGLGVVATTTTSASVHAAPAKVNPSCYVTVVYLYGTDAPTVSCQVQSKPSGRNSTRIGPLIGQYPCGDRMPTPWVSLDENISFGGAQICFVGVGSVNLTGTWAWWNDRTSSFNMGANGLLSVDSNGNGNHCTFGYGSRTSNINTFCGSGWNDVVSYVQIDS